MPQPVLDAVQNHFNLEARIGGYEAADQARETLDRTRTTAAELIGAAPDEIALVEHATRAWGAAFYGFTFRTGDRILTAQATYASNYIAFLQTAQRTGAVVEVIPDDAYGQIDVSALENRLDDDVKLIALTHVPTSGGLVNPAAEVGRVAQGAGIPFLLDACQSVGQLTIDVKAIGCDMLSTTGRKWLRGPRGTGFLYVSRALAPQLDPPFLDMYGATLISETAYAAHPDARRFENWEKNHAALIGMGVAIDYARQWGLEAIEQRVSALAGRLREQLSQHPALTVHDQGQRQCGIVTFSVVSQTADTVKQYLRSKNMNVSITSPPYTRLDLGARGLPAVVRASVHYYNTEIEINRFIEALRFMGF